MILPHFQEPNGPAADALAFRLVSPNDGDPIFAVHDKFGTVALCYCTGEHMATLCMTEAREPGSLRRAMKLEHAVTRSARSAAQVNLEELEIDL